MGASPSSTFVSIETFFCRVPLEPAPVIQRFANGDAIQPSLQRTALPEAANATKSLEKHLLRAIGGVRRVTQHAEDEVVDRSVVVGYQPVKRSLRASLQLGDKLTFVAAP